MLIFDKLWKNHPTITGDDNPCQTNGRPNFTHQCAIRMGVCLARCGVDTSRLPGVTHCWYGHRKSQGHTVKDCLYLDGDKGVLDAIYPFEIPPDSWPPATRGDYPMHLHSEMSQTAAGGYYLFGAVTEIHFVE